MKNNLTRVFIFIVLAFVACKKGNEIPDVDKSKIENRIIDEVGALTQNEEKSLFSQVQDIQRELGPEISIVLIDTLNGVDINMYSNNLFERLQLGRPVFKDGLLLVVSVKDSDVRMEVGYGLELIIRDEIANQILREQMGPFFKDDKFYEGFSEGLKEIKNRIKLKKELIGRMP